MTASRTAAGVQTFRLTVGLPHTNRDGLAEHLLLMHAGHLHWLAIARAIGRPLSALRSASGDEVYATFYFIEEHFPDGTPLSTFRLDDTLRFVIWLRAFKNVALEGRILFDHDRRLRKPGELQPASGDHPLIRFANIFTLRTAGNRRLTVAAPANADFSALRHLPDQENAYHLTRRAVASGTLGLIGDGWQRSNEPPFETCHTIDPDRDTNGAGLVYFANYVAFINSAEREALRRVDRFRADGDALRDLRQRRLAYFGNAEPGDTLRLAVDVFGSDDRDLVAFRCRVRRERDDRLICLSESTQRLRARM